MCDLLLRKSRHVSSRHRVVFSIFLFVVFALFAGQASAINLQLFEKELVIKGYVNQMAQFGISGDKYDTMQGFQQAVMQALLEVEYYPAQDLKFFVSGLLFKDWAYNIYDSDDDWNFKTFDKARNEMSLRTDYEDVLKECHVTWSPAGFNLRVGKQIVSWGRMDGVRIMDQINPKDVRLGPSDVEFETSVIPIWLAKLEYYPEYKPYFLQDIGLEFIFNPNVDFIPDKGPFTGNYEHGIWGVNSIIPSINARVGAGIKDFDEPDSWTDGREYAVRVKSTFQDGTILTLNFFKGVEDNPVFMPDYSKGLSGIWPSGYFDDKGRPIFETYLTGYYPDKKFAGFTFAKDFPSLYISALGGVAPLLRCEAIYEFDTTFAHVDTNFLLPPYRFEEHDAIFWGLGIDWKFKWNLLNSRRYFSLMPQFTMRHIRDYPSAPGTYLTNPGGEVTSENWYAFSVMMMTYYLNDKLTPMIYYQRDIRQDVNGITDGSTKGDLWLLKLTYAPNSTWSYQAQLTLMENDLNNELARGMGNKDNISFTVKYQF